VTPGRSHKLHAARNQSKPPAKKSLLDFATKNLNKAVRRNKDRFPHDFMFQLTKKEVGNLRFQFGTSKIGGRRYLP